MTAKNKLLILFFVLLFLVPTVFSQPPFQESTATSSLKIVVPSIEYFEVNNNIKFYVHVFNSSDYIITNETTDCVFHVYDSFGNHTIEDEMSFETDGTEFFYNINSSIINYIGTLGFIVQCNNTKEAGFFSGYVDINDRSQINGAYSPNILSIILASIITILFFSIIGYFCLRFSGINENSTTFWFSILCFGLSLIEFIYMLGILYMNEVGYILTELLKIHFYIIIILGFGVGFASLILLTIYIFRWRDEEKKEEKW